MVLTPTMTDNVTLSKVRENESYNLAQIMENSDSDFLPDDIFKLSLNPCEYHDPKDILQINSNKETRNMLSVFGLNVRGLTTNYDGFKNLLSDMTDNKFSFDFIGITEIHTIIDSKNYTLDGYHKPEMNPRPAGDDGKGGVGMYIKSEIEYKPRDDISIFIPHIIETLFVEFRTNHKNIISVIIYRPNTLPRADIDIFIKSLSDILNIIKNEKKSAILMGDFNIDLLKYETHSKTNDFIDDMFSLGFSPLITKPTRLTSHSATLIDHIYTDLLLDVCRSGIVITDVADHFGIFTQLNLDKPKHRPKTYQTRPFCEEKIKDFKTVLRGTDFTDILGCNEVDNCYNNFITKFQSIFENVFPLETKTTNRKYVRREPWVTKGLLISSQHKFKLFKNKINKPTTDNIEHYKTYLNIFNRVKRDLKKIYYETILDEYRYDMKKTWNVLHQLIVKTKTNTSFNESFKINDKPTSDAKEIAEGFNSFFSNISSAIINNIPPTDIDYREHLKGNHVKNFFMEPVVPADLISVAKTIKPKVSYGHDGISNKILKESINEISLPLAHIYNLSISSGVFPNNMKIAKIIPIFKSGDKSCLNNYRPISLLPAFSKLLEKIVHKRLIAFLQSNNIIYEHQYGFQPKHSTVHPLIHFVKSISDSNDLVTKDLSIGIFLDLSKAFDTVSHSILAQKLNFYGIRGIALSWFESYLSKRTQYVEFKGQKSQMSDVKHGVPQGSILGPLLFLIYINDLPNCTHLNILSYADDTTLYKSVHSIDTLSVQINTELENVYVWLRANKLSLNLMKSKYMLFGPKSPLLQPQQLSIKIQDIEIEQGSKKNNQASLKFLGINFDENLNWKDHILTVCKKINRGIFALNQVKNILPQSCLRSLYHTLVHSHMTYCLEIWGNSCFINKIFMLQKKAIRIIHRASFRSHTEPLFKNSKILKITDLYEMKLLLFAHDYRNNLLPKSFLNFFPVRNPYVTTRQSNNIYIHKPRTNFSASSISHKTVSAWNNLPNNLKIINSRSIFKQSIRSKFIDSYSDNIICSNERCQQCNHS